MICRYTSDFNDFRDAQRLHMCQRRYHLLHIILWKWILPIAGVLSLGLLLYDIVWRHFSFPPLVGGILAATAWLGIATMILQPIYWKRCYKQMKNGRRDDEPIEFEITGEEIISRIPGLNEGRFRRKGVYKFVEDEKIALIYVAKNRFLFLPKRSLDDEQRIALRRWIAGEQQSLPEEQNHQQS